MTLRLGRYETIRAVASGGMATVHLARALGAGGFERLVAIKVLHPHIQSEPDFVAMFLDEARLAAQVRHPNVVPTIDVSTDPLFLVMEYVEGPSLHAVQRDLRRQNKVVPLEVALRITLDLLAGLHAAHELTDSSGTLLNFVHRDVSPHNILLGVDGVTRITDFGVARAESRLSSTRGGQVKGKLAYMAPEQVRAALSIGAATCMPQASCCTSCSPICRYFRRRMTLRWSRSSRPAGVNRRAQRTAKCPRRSTRCA